MSHQALVTVILAGLVVSAFGLFWWGDLVRLEPFARGISLKRPMEMELGPDGALYLIKFGTAWENNKDAQVIRIEYTGAGGA